MAGYLPQPAEIAQIGAAIAHIRDRLSPSSNDHRDKAIELAELFAAFPAQAQSEAPVKVRMGAYFEALRELPAWAVHEARVRIIRGDVADINPRFAPTPPELVAVVRAVLVRLRRDLDDLLAIDQAVKNHRPVSETERANVAEKFEQEVERLRANAGKDGLKTRAISLGIDPAVLAEIPDAPPRNIGLQKAEFSQLETGNARDG